MPADDMGQAKTRTAQPLAGADGATGLTDKDTSTSTSIGKTTARRSPILCNAAVLDWLRPALAIIVVALTLMALVPGWLLGLDLTARLHPDFPRMVPGTAISLLLIALSQLVTLRADTVLSLDRSRRLRRAGLLLSAGAGCYAALRLGLWLGTGGTGAAMPLLEPASPPQVLAPGASISGGDLSTLASSQPRPALDRPRDAMSLATVLCLMLAAGGSALRSSASTWVDPVLRHRARMTATAGLLLSLIGFSGYVIDGDGFGEVLLFSSMGVLTCLCLMCLFLGLLLARPVEGWAGLLLGRGDAGRSARRLVALALIVPPLLGIALRLGHEGFGGGLLLTFGSDPSADPDPDFLLGLMLVLLGAAAMAISMIIASDRAEAAQHMKNEERRLSDILDGIDNAVFAFDPSGALLHVNEAAQALTIGAPSPSAWLDQARFHHLQQRAPLEDGERPLQRLIRSGHPGDMTLGYLDPAQDERILHFVASRTGTPEATGQWILNVTDETARWRMRSQLDRAERLDAIGQMSGGIAHEMANILGVIRLSADTGQLTEDAISHGRYFSAIQEACDRGTELTERILAISQSQGYGARPFEAARVIREATTFARRTMPSNIALQVRMPRKPLPTGCDPRDLENAILNLLLNAQNAIIEADQRTGRILLSVTRSDDAIIVTVEDDGPGMSPDVLSRATEPFFTTRQHSGGTGLGLAMVQNFASRSEGRLFLSSAEGRGTTARLTFPALPEVEDHAAFGLPAHPAPEDGPIGPLDLTGLKLLLAEDDVLFGETVGDSLRLLGASLVAASTASAAAELLRSRRDFDLLITDIVLPGGLNGFDLAALAREQRPDLPVIYVSGYGADSHSAQERPPGIYLRKPVSMQVLAHSISRLCRAPA